MGKLESLHLQLATWDMKFMQLHEYGDQDDEKNFNTGGLRLNLLQAMHDTLPVDGFV